MSEQPRTIKIYNLLAGTNEFIGEGDAYIPPHTGLPANSTDRVPSSVKACAALRITQLFVDIFPGRQ
ncbi:hypothetical protein JQY64_004298 [Escherichia coli]|nr:hypothetical protein [Escherichia coli]